MSVNTIVLKRLAPEQPTAYIRGGATRQVGNQIPLIDQVLTVGTFAADDRRWSLAPAAAEDWARVQFEWAKLGGEPVRITDAFRDQYIQQAARNAYEAWLKAGSPEPGSSAWRVGMKSAYVARPGESMHGCGCAVDIDVQALWFPGLVRGSAAALRKFWEVAAKFGWTPAIRQPDPTKPECWHFDHKGALAAVEELYQRNGYDPAYDDAARVGCALAGTLPVGLVRDLEIAYLQARLTVAGHFCGAIDGVVGPKTKAALGAAEVKPPAKWSSSAVLVLLNELGVGLEQIGRI